MLMKYSVHILLVLLGVAACAPLSIYHKPGVSVSQLESDTLTCEVSALKQAPVALQTRREPPSYFPGHRYCNSDGHCFNRGGYWLPGSTYSVDVNAALRRKVETQCMSQKGYRPVKVPICASNVSEQVDTAQTQILPQITDESCAIKNNDGSWQIITVKKRS